LFSQGERLVSFDLEESERIIRKSPYVYDVRIVPRRIENNPDSVDIMVYVKISGASTEAWYTVPPTTPDASG